MLMSIKKITALVVCTILSVMGVTVNADEMGVAAWIGRYGVYCNSVAEVQEGLWVRDIEEWADFEKDENGIVIPDSMRARYKKLKSEGKNIIMVLSYGNKLYADSNVTMPTVDNEEYFEKWLNYVRTMVTEFKDEVNHFEIWNEPNLEYANANASAAEYGKMAAATKKVIEEVHPLKEDAVVIGGAFAYSSSHNLFVTNFYNNGGSEMDGLSFHIYEYGSKPEENWLKNVKSLGTLLTLLNYNKPIWLTETGYYTAESGVDEKTQAEYLIRMQVLWDNFLKGRNQDGKMFWFFTNDFGEDRTTVSENHGLLRVNGTAKDSFYSFKTLNSFIDDKTFKELNVDNGNYTAVYENELNHDKTYVLWNSENSSTEKSVTVDCDIVNVYNYKGDKVSNASSNSNTVTVTTSASPILIECENYGASITSIAYKKEKRLLMVKGKCNYADTVKLEVEKNGAVADTVTTKVVDGEYEKDIYTDVTDSCTVYAGRDTTYYNDSKTFVLDEETETDITIENVALAVNGNKVTINGNAKNAESGKKISIMVLPDTVNAENAIANNLGHIGETTVSENKFSYEFSMPLKSEGKYKLYIGGENVTDVANKDFDYGTNNHFVGVCNLSATKQKEVTVYASLNNTDTSKRTASIVIGQFKGDVLKSIKIEEVEVDAGTVLGQMYKITASLDADATEIKAFIFDDMDNIIPLVECVCLE